MSYFYIHGTYLKSIDFDLVVVSTILLTKKIIYKHYVWYIEGARTLSQDSQTNANFSLLMAKAKKGPDGKGGSKSESEIDITIKLNKKIEIYRDLISKKSLIIDVGKCVLFLVFVICFVRVGFKNTYTKTLFLIYPSII